MLQCLYNPKLTLFTFFYLFSHAYTTLLLEHFQTVFFSLWLFPSYSLHISSTLSFPFLHPHPNLRLASSDLKPATNIVLTTPYKIAMDDDDDLPTIDLNPLGSDTISSGVGEGSSSNGGSEPLLGDHGQISDGHDQPPQDGVLSDAVPSNGEPVSADPTNSQGEEATGLDNNDDESALPSSFQGKSAPSIKSEEGRR